MSRHRNSKNMMDDYEDEDYDEDEFTISLVAKQVGKVGRKRIIAALDSTNWVPEAAVKLLKQPTPAKQAQGPQPQAKKAPEPQTKKASEPQTKKVPELHRGTSEETKQQALANLDADYPDVFPQE